MHVDIIIISRQDLFVLLCVVQKKQKYTINTEICNLLIKELHVYFIFSE